MEFGTAVVAVLKSVVVFMVVRGNFVDGARQHGGCPNGYDQYQKKGEYAVHASSTQVRSMKWLDGYGGMLDFTK
jgi:hypothetical protein